MRQVTNRSGFDDAGLGPAFDAMKYPIVSGGVYWIVGLALIELIPYAGALSWILAMVVSIAIIKSSLWGGQTMPRRDAFLPMSELLPLLGKGLAATVVVLWPLVIVYVVKLNPELSFLGGLVIFLLFSIFFFLYFLPAALVSLARGDGLADALTPILLKQVVKEKERSYQTAAALLCVGGFFLMFVVSILNAIPHVGAVLGRVITIYYQFAFARFFGVLYLLPREQRVAHRAALGQAAETEGEPEPEAGSESKAEDEPAPVA